MNEIQTSLSGTDVHSISRKEGEQNQVTLTSNIDSIIKDDTEKTSLDSSPVKEPPLGSPAKVSEDEKTTTGEHRSSSVRSLYGVLNKTSDTNLDGENDGLGNIGDSSTKVNENTSELTPVIGNQPSPSSETEAPPPNEEWEFEEECVSEGQAFHLQSALLCVVCGKEGLKRCLICLKGFCNFHTPSQTSYSQFGIIPYPDDKKILPFKCPNCYMQKSIGGISFVEESETASDPLSRQLQPIVYQPQNLRVAPSQSLTDCFERNILNGRACISVFVDDESKLKQYALRPESRGLIVEQLGEISCLNDLEKHIADKRTIFLHYKYDPEKFIIPLGRSNVQIPQNGLPVDPRIKYNDALLKSDVLIGMLIRKAAVSLECEHAGLRKLHIRLELYVQNKLWKSFSSHQQNSFKYIQILVEGSITKLFQDWILERKKNKNQVQQRLILQNQLHLNRVSNEDPSNVLLAYVLSPQRDCFKYKPLTLTIQQTSSAGKTYQKIEWYFAFDCLPEQFVKSGPPVRIKPDGYNYQIDAFPIGVTTYNEMFTDDELKELEAHADIVDENSREGGFNEKPNTAQSTIKHSKLVRTKFFFKARYLWHGRDVRAKDGMKAEGIRVDVADPPNWMKEIVEKRWVECGIIQENWVNQYAMNMYHDGSEGIKQHFDDIKRFDRPIYSVRLFSPSRLCFGSLGFAMSNSIFYIPMPRGCVTVLGPGFASDHIKHCVRASDMNGKSCALLLRRIYPKLIEEANSIMKDEEKMKALAQAQAQAPAQVQAQTPTPTPIITTPTPVPTQLPVPVPAPSVPQQSMGTPVKVVQPLATLVSRLPSASISSTINSPNIQPIVSVPHKVKIVPATTPIERLMPQPNPANSISIQNHSEPTTPSIPSSTRTTIPKSFPPGYVPVQLGNIGIAGLQALKLGYTPIQLASASTLNLVPSVPRAIPPVKVVTDSLVASVTAKVSQTLTTELPINVEPSKLPSTQSEQLPFAIVPVQIPSKSNAEPLAKETTLAPPASSHPPSQQSIEDLSKAKAPVKATEAPNPPVKAETLNPPVKAETLHPPVKAEAPRPPVKVPYKFSENSPAKKVVENQKKQASTPIKRVPLAPIPKHMISKELQARLAAEKLKKEIHASKKSNQFDKPVSPNTPVRSQTIKPIQENPKPIEKDLPAIPAIPLETTPNLAKVLQRLHKTTPQTESTLPLESLKRSSDSIQSPQTTPEGSPLLATDSPTIKRFKISNEQNKENHPNQSMDTQ